MSTISNIGSPVDTLSIDFEAMRRDQSLFEKAVYVACNEPNQSRTLALLQHKPAIENGVHFGWSFEMNYKITVLRKPRYAFICDVEPLMHRVYAHVRDLMLKEANVENFKTKLSACFAKLNVQSANSTISMKAEELVQHLSATESFLSNQASYDLIRTMYQTNRIFHLNLDASKDPQDFIALKNWIKDQNCVLDTLYATNIVEWVADFSSQADYRTNLAHLFDRANHTLFIYANRDEDSQSPMQKLTNHIPQDFIHPPKKTSRIRSFAAERSRFRSRMRLTYDS